MGLPDLYCFHKKYRQRWVEVKNLESYHFTKAQLDNFPKMTEHDCGIWVLTGATDNEYKKLWQPPNWQMFLPNMNIRGAKMVDRRRSR